MLPAPFQTPEAMSEREDHHDARPSDDGLRVLAVQVAELSKSVGGQSDRFGDMKGEMGKLSTYLRAQTTIQKEINDRVNADLRRIIEKQGDQAKELVVLTERMPKDVAVNAEVDRRFAEVESDGKKRDEMLKHLSEQLTQNRNETATVRETVKRYIFAGTALISVLMLALTMYSSISKPAALPAAASPPPAVRIYDGPQYRHDAPAPAPAGIEVNP